MSKYRIPVAALLVILVVPVWVAGFTTAWCPRVAPGPHQCCMARQAAASSSASPDGSLGTFVQCHCGSIPPVVNDQAPAALYLAQWTAATTAHLSDEGGVAAVSGVAARGQRVHATPLEAPFLLHCAFLI